jgi:uncharacterized protein CbrC (UPF0167 family)
MANYLSDADYAISLRGNGYYSNGRYIDSPMANTVSGYNNATTTTTSTHGRAVYVTVNSMTGEMVMKEYIPKTVSCGTSEDNANKLNALFRDEKTMDIIKFAKGLALTSDEKAMRKVGFQDENGNWAPMAHDVTKELLAKDNGFKSWKEMSVKYGVCPHSAAFSVLEWKTLLDKYEAKLLEIAIAKLADDKEKCCD